MDNPCDAKYGMTREQIGEAFRIMKSKGVKHFGIHAFLASNTVTNDYYPLLAKVLFQLAVELKEETGADIRFINFQVVLEFRTVRISRKMTSMPSLQV